MTTCHCGNPSAPGLAVFCEDCFGALKRKYRKELIEQYGHEVLSMEAHLAELQEAVEKFLGKANDTPVALSAGAVWKSMLGDLSQALADSKKRRKPVGME